MICIMENTKKINFIVSSTQYTGYGGAATVAYAMVKYLRNLNYKCAGLFFNKSKCVNYNPNKFEGIYLMRYNHTSYQKYKDKDHSKIESFCEITKNKIIEYLNDYPDIIFCIGNQSPSFCREMFPDSKIIMITSGIIYYKRNQEFTSINDLINKFNNSKSETYKKTSYAKQEIIDIELSNLIVPNSDIMLDVYKSIYPEFIEKIYNKYFDTSKLVENLDKIEITNDVEKDIDIIIVSSRLDRYEKNNLFLLPILEKYDKYTKCFVGDNNEKFRHITNSIFTGLIPHDKIYDYFKRSKLLIVPSLYESSNNTVREALQCKCLILTSNNVGFYSLYPKFSICDTYNTTDWESKMTYILDNYDSLIVDYKIDFSGSCTVDEICNTVAERVI